MNLVWLLIFAYLFVDDVKCDTTASLNENQRALGSSFVVSAGYGVQENQNHRQNWTGAPVYFSGQTKIVKKDQPNISDDVIYGSSSDNIERTYVNEDNDKPSIGDLQNLIRKLEDSKSSKIVRVLKVPAIYEIHMHSNNDGNKEHVANEQYVHIQPEHFGNLKLNHDYMKKLQKTVHPTQNSYRNLRNVPLGNHKNVPDKNNNVKYLTPKHWNYNTNILADLKNNVGLDEYRAENSDMKIQNVELNNVNQPQAIYEVPAPVFGKYPHPQPFNQAKIFRKNHKYITAFPKSENKKTPTNHKVSPSNLSPTYYMQNNIFPDLSLYYRTKEALEKNTKHNYVWESKKIKSRTDTPENATLQNSYGKMRNSLRQRKNLFVKTNVYPAMRFMLYIKEKTFEGD